MFHVKRNPRLHSCAVDSSKTHIRPWLNVFTKNLDALGEKGNDKLFSDVIQLLKINLN